MAHQAAMEKSGIGSLASVASDKKRKKKEKDAVAAAPHLNPLRGFTDPESHQYFIDNFKLQNPSVNF